MHIEELLRGIDKNRATRDHGRGIENIPTCPTCSRATLLIEHEYQPQIFLGFYKDSEPEREREGTYFTCEWCGSPIDPRDVPEQAPRKPAVSAGGESDEEWARRVA
jgi:hypothetical protein